MRWMHTAWQQSFSFASDPRRSVASVLSVFYFGRSRLFLLGRGEQLNLSPVNLAKQLIAAAGFDAVRQLPTVDVAVVAEPERAAVVGRVGNHIQSGELAIARIEDELHFDNVAGGQQD